MEQIPRYKVVYAESAIRDIEEKLDYIATRFRGPESRGASVESGSISLAMTWCYTVWTMNREPSISGRSVQKAGIYRHT